VSFSGLQGPGSSGGAFGGEFGRALARERAGRRLPSPAVLEGVLARKRRRRLERWLAIARFLRVVR
jgi:hypothetical protein